jgi:hypothetical protein
MQGVWKDDRMTCAINITRRWLVLRVVNLRSDRILHRRLLGIRDSLPRRAQDREALARRNVRRDGAETL